MAGNKIKLLFILLFLINTILLFADPYIVLDDKVKMINDIKSKKVITQLPFLDTVYTFEKTSVNTNYFFVKTMSDIKGWIDKKEINYYGKTWKKYSFINKSSIRIPANQHFKYLTAIGYENNQKYYEYKLYNKKYFIIVCKRKKNIREIIKTNKKAHDTIYFEKYLELYKLKAVYHYRKSIVDEKKEYALYIKLNKNTTYTILVDLEKDSQDKDYHLTAKKILFSLAFE